MIEPLLASGTDAAKDTENIEVEGRHIAIYSPEQMTRLLQAASTRTLPVLVLCGFCGLRTAEALRLSWEAIDFEQGHVIVEAHQSKTASRRIVPLSENAAIPKPTKNWPDSPANPSQLSRPGREPPDAAQTMCS